MILNRSLNLIPTRENKTRVFPRREDNASPARTEGPHEYSHWQQTHISLAYVIMVDSSLSSQLGMTKLPSTLL